MRHDGEITTELGFIQDLQGFLNVWYWLHRVYCDRRCGWGFIVWGIIISAYYAGRC